MVAGMGFDDKLNGRIRITAILALILQHIIGEACMQHDQNLFVARVFSMPPHGPVFLC